MSNPAFTLSKTEKVDYANIGLMLISLVVALLLPFQLFLFSYAVLGPLHYLTEIGWLGKNDYFIQRKKDFWILVALCVLISLGAFWATAAQAWNDWYLSTKDAPLGKFGSWLSQASPGICCVAFVSAIGLVAFHQTWQRIGCVVAGIAMAIALHKLPGYILVFGMFMPTLIHVCVFTGLFILYGALKSKKISGFLSFGVFLLCTLSFFFWPMDAGAERAKVSPYILDAFVKSNMHMVNSKVSEWLGGPANQLDLKVSVTYQVQAFIAFAYTYHYLNWFSKTEIIRWHQVPRRSLIASIFIWVASIVLYAYDYRLGLIALFALSILHVFLEFPLNYKTIAAVGQAGKNLIFPAKK
jgi:hypothetical protein